MEVRETELDGVLVITPRRFGDHRGAFSQTYQSNTYAEIGVTPEFVQDNHSRSSAANTLRGLHFQAPPHAQAKLVHCIRGAIFDVAVDIRRGSPSYGKWVGVTLTAETGAQIYVPEGFAHGFVTLQPDSEIIYKCSGYYAPECEGSVRWDDPDLAIEWPQVSGPDVADGPPVLSDKDLRAQHFADLDSPFFWEGGK